VLAVIRIVRRRHRQRGQALVEFALVFPILVLVLFSIIQFSMLLGGQDGMANAVREATRYAATVPVANSNDAGSCGSGVGSQVYSQLNTALGQKVPGYVATNLVGCGAPAPASTVVYCLRANPDGTSSIWVQVTAVYRHPLYIPLVSNIVDLFDGVADGRLRASTSEQMRVETYALSGPYRGGFLTCT
jgi:Flp pilus assembly protein TadG